MRGQGIKLTSYISKKCREKGTLMPVIEKIMNNESFEGAIVLPPKCGLYLDRPVACVDYSSLYPSTIVSYNLSHDSKVSTKEYNLDDVSTEMSFLEMLDALNKKLIESGDNPVAFDNDCREGICGCCSLFVNGKPHGPGQKITTCELHMRAFKDGSTAPMAENYIRESILNTTTNIVTGFDPVMPTFQGRFSQDELDAVIAYIKSLN